MRGEAADALKGCARADRVFRCIGEGRRMAAMRRSLELALIAGVACCGARPPPLPEVAFQRSRPAVPWPRRAPPCEIQPDAVGDLCAAPFDVLRAPGGAIAARVDRAGFVRTVWSELPLLGAARWARVDVRGEGLHLRGWASLDGREFEVKDRVDVVPGHVWVPSGATAEILGTSGDRVVIAVRTPFSSPSSLEVATSCDRLGRGSSSVPVAAGPPFAVATRGRIDLRASPGGPVVLSFDVGSDDAWVWIDRRGDHVRIAGGQPAWMRWPRYAALLFDGWVSADQVDRIEAVEEWNDSGCHPVDLWDRCPLPSVVRDAPVWAGASPGGEPVGTLERGAPIDIVARRSDFVAFELHNRLIMAPEGMMFWLRAADVDVGCGRPGREDEDGCPRCDVSP
jgi:hypothetical protein